MSITAADIDRDLHEARRTVRQFWNFANLCYCGDDAEMLRLILWALEAYGEPGQWNDAERPDLANPTHMLLAYMLDAWDLTDHGTSMYGAFLTPDGRRLRDTLRRVDLTTALDQDWHETEHSLYPTPRTGPDEVHEGEWVSEND